MLRVVSTLRSAAVAGSRARAPRTAGWVALAGLAALSSQLAFADPATAHARHVASEHDDDDEDAEEQCPFCRFMKGGACRNVFIAWEQCVEKHRGADAFIEQCSVQTLALKECCDANPDYYNVLEEADAGDKGKEGQKGKRSSH